MSQQQDKPKAVLPMDKKKDPRWAEKIGIIVAMGCTAFAIAFAILQA